MKNAPILTNKASNYWSCNTESINVWFIMCLSIYHYIMPLKRGKYDAERGKFHLHGNVSK